MNLIIAYVFTCLNSGQNAFFADTTVVIRAGVKAVTLSLATVVPSSEIVNLVIVASTVIVLHLTILMLQRRKKVRRQTIKFATNLLCDGLEDATFDAIDPRSISFWSNAAATVALLTYCLQTEMPQQ